MNSKVLRLFLLLALGQLATSAKRGSSLPRHIMPCYSPSGNASEEWTRTKHPMTIKVLIDLLRKVERFKDNALNMRMLASSLIHYVRFDGIEIDPELAGTTGYPYSASGLQFGKFVLLEDFLVPGDPDLFPRQSLSTKEFCILHQMVSSTIDKWERGDESRTCRKTMMGEIRIGSPKYPLSKCPIEKGVVKTPWGTVNVANVITAITAELQEPLVGPDQVPGESHDPFSVWTPMSSLAGDLAESLLYQDMDAEDIVLGANGSWNEGNFPTDYYLQWQTGHELTKAEALGGIDGILLADNVRYWVEKFGRFRLSQLLDMYYSDRMVPGIQIQACQRAAPDFQRLEEEVKKLAIVLQEISEHSKRSYSNDEIGVLANALTKKFAWKADQWVKENSWCEKKRVLVPMDIYVAFDSSMKYYDGIEFLYHLSENVDLHPNGVNIMVIDGNDGTPITNMTGSTLDLLMDIEALQKWTVNMDLPKCLQGVQTAISQTLELAGAKVTTNPRAKVALIIAPTDTLTERDIEQSLHQIKYTKAMDPNIALLYAVSNSNEETFKPFANNHYTNDVVFATPGDIQGSVAEIRKRLEEIPSPMAHIFEGRRSVQMEDYVTPGEVKQYAAHYLTLKKYGNYMAEFVGNDYGTVSFCAMDVSQNKQLCKLVGEHETVEFKLNEICGKQKFCNAAVTAEVINSTNRCTEIECRYPDQVRVNIRISAKSTSDTTSFSVLPLAVSLISKLFFM